ncbi:hypothetical protein GBF38_022885 [Nibea albiflora]|uniref:Uncharacterized protein n=1 Tax=Nibea albiflora TaxID=240163 RepID=A0ACB7EYM8_NIBAL|nr:hypothetical protein GBF38_022885 [Nibea albiflora]
MNYSSCLESILEKVKPLIPTIDFDSLSFDDEEILTVYQRPAGFSLTVPEDFSFSMDDDEPEELLKPAKPDETCSRRVKMDEEVTTTARCGTPHPDGDFKAGAYERGIVDTRLDASVKSDCDKCRSQRDMMEKLAAFCNTKTSKFVSESVRSPNHIRMAAELQQSHKECPTVYIDLRCHDPLIKPPRTSPNLSSESKSPAKHNTLQETPPAKKPNLKGHSGSQIEGSPGMVGDRAHDRRKHLYPAATKSHIYNTLVAWFLSLVGPDPRHNEDEAGAKVPFWVAGLQQLWTEDGLALHVLVVARHCYAAKVIDRVFGLSPGFYWQTVETQEHVCKGRETTLDLHTEVSVAQGSKAFFLHPIITHYTLQLVLDSGLDVCGLRLLYPPQEFLSDSAADLLLVVSPVVPPYCYGQILAVCERRSLSLMGLQRLQLQTNGATVLGLTKQQVELQNTQSSDFQKHIRCMWSLPDPSSVTLSRQKRSSNSNMEQVVVLTLCGKDMSHGLSLLHRVLTEEAEGEGQHARLKLLGLKYLPALSRFQAQELSPYEVGEQLYLDSLDNLMSSPALVCALRQMAHLSTAPCFIMALQGEMIVTHFDLILESIYKERSDLKKLGKMIIYPEYEKEAKQLMRYLFNALSPERCHTIVP